VIKILAFLVAFVAGSAFAFPEMVRHGYQRCDVCHVSPDGGGTVTAYGRALSKEVLSTWGTEKETEFAYGAITLPEWLSLGGDVRFAQVHVDTATVRAGRSILMQADLEAAVTKGKFTFDATLGAQSEFLSRRHFIQFKPSDHWSFRVGRFNKAYGIHLPDHIVEIRKMLGWDQGTETYNTEAAYFGEDGEIFATGQFGRPDRPAVNEEKGAGLRAALNLGDRAKLGVSYFYGTRTGEKRHVGGPYAIVGFSTNSFLLAEIDLQNQTIGTAPAATGAASYLKFAYEPVQGLLPYVSHEYSQLDFKNGNGRRILYTGGIQWFPRPHVELVGAYQKQKLSSVAGGDVDYLYFMAHYYF
jgi:hypothetical protein